MTSSAEVPPDVVGRLRSICLALPESYEEQAWVGMRWRVRKRTFAHVLTITSGWPPAYARAAATDGPAVVMTFQSAGPELDVLAMVGHPFFRPEWGRDIIGMVIEPEADWGEVDELLTESYCALAPRMLVQLVERPEG